MVLRVYELDNPIVREYLPEYGGCKSWVDVDAELTRPMTAVVSSPVFQKNLESICAILSV